MGLQRWMGQSPGPPDQERPLGSTIVGHVGQDRGGDVPVGGSGRVAGRHWDRARIRMGQGSNKRVIGAVVEGIDLPGLQWGVAGEQQEQKESEQPQR